MKKFLKMFGLAGLLAGMMMVSGCGDDNSPAVVTKSNAIPATSATVAAGTVTVTTSVEAKTAGDVTALTIPVGVTFSATGTSDTAFTTLPAINVSTPSNGTTSGVAPAKIGTTSFTVTDAAGAVDISFGTASKVTFTGAGATVVIPVVKAPATTEVVAIKSDGTSQSLTGAYTAPATGTISASNPGKVTVNGVTNFCWFVVSPTFANPSGSTGSYGTIVK